MKSLLKVILVIALCSGSTFVIFQLTGLITIDKIEIWLKAAKEISPLYLGITVILLMLVDLFISIPTLATIMLAGYLMGFPFAALAAITGLMITGINGYILGTIFGEKIVKLIIKDKRKQNEVSESFNDHGLMMILLSRAAPILPEITTVLAGMSRMPFLKFIAAWGISIIPYTLFAAYAGSISSLKSPEPAIIAWVILSGVLWSGWWLFRKKKLIS